MINADMRFYDYLIYGEKNAYGQPTLSERVRGKIKIAINTTAQAVQDNINYKDAQYIGLTHANVDDTYVIVYGEERLKVLYVNPKGRMKQVFLAKL